MTVYSRILHTAAPQQISSDIVINWAGGLHHAKKREASGFCYINDIAVSRPAHSTNSGNVSPVPELRRIEDEERGGHVVLQYGVDSLAGDELGYFNLAINGHPHCVQYLRAFNVPLILLGGGGYTVKNVARIWTYETVYALGIRDDIDPNLPWNECFEWFGPCYRLKFPENNMDGLSVRNENSDKSQPDTLQSTPVGQGAGTGLSEWEYTGRDDYSANFADMLFCSPTGALQVHPSSDGLKVPFFSLQFK
ncbi:hypothetical protein BDR07DRAFT_1377124 [Suillus spraguei]|nr:hypothetical protein BDR07DRAFT_1377124 [Suillus spraguei]